MSETKTPWTPGKWTVRDRNECGELWAIASDHDFKTSAGHSYREYVAQFVKFKNAHLIAAAPAMAEALHNTVSILKTLSTPDDPIAQTAIREGEAALALAKGETK